MKRLSNLTAMMILGSIQLYGERRLLVSIPDRRLAVIVDGKVVKTYPVAVGKSRTPSPRGTFKIVTRVPNPTWYGPHKIIGPGKSNPLGTRWMGLSEKGYGVHGTNVPSSIGKAASHGCIRMRNHDVEELFELVQTGDTVDLVGERDEQVTAMFPAAETLSAGGGD